MKKILLPLLLLAAAQTWGQQLPVKDLLRFYALRSQKSAFTAAAKQEGFHFAARPLKNAYDGFIAADTSTVLLVKWGDDLVYSFKETAQYGQVLADLKALGFEWGNRYWYDRDEKTHFVKEGVEIVVVRYDFRTASVRYGVIVSPRPPKR